MKSPFKTPVVIQTSSNEGVGLLMKEVPGQVICEFDQTPEMQDHAHFVALAVNRFPNLCSQVGELTASHNEVSAKLAKAVRMREIIADISFYVGHRWHGLTETVREYIMDDVNGSRGLMERAVDWAEEFDRFWEALPEDDERRENYISEVDEFASSKFDELYLRVFNARA
jgi:hypothetical protein